MLAHERCRIMSKAQLINAHLFRVVAFLKIRWHLLVLAHLRRVHRAFLRAFITLQAVAPREHCPTLLHLSEHEVF